jgi:hypothetical protein
MMEVYRESRGVVLLILNLSAGWKWGVNIMLQSLYPCETILVPLPLPWFIPWIFQHVAWSLYPLCYPSSYEQSTSVFTLRGQFRSRIMNVLVIMIIVLLMWMHKSVQMMVQCSKMSQNVAYHFFCVPSATN